MGTIFFVVLLFTLIVAQIGGSLLSPGLYVSLLDDNDVYEFALVDLPSAFLQDRRAVEETKMGDKVEDTPLLQSGLTTERIVAGLNRAVPPEWLQEAVERNLEEFGNYVTGQRDDFTLLIATDERADDLVVELRALLDEADAYAVFHERLLVPQIEEAAADWTRDMLPFGIEVSEERIATAARAVLPAEWARLQGQSIFYQAASYLKGDTDELALSISFSDRVDIAAEEVKDILAESPAYDLLYDEVIAPEITERLGETVEGLPFGATVSSAEVVDALRDAAPSSWVRGQAERLIDKASPYIAGRVDGFEFEVSLLENKRLAHGVLTGLVEGKIQVQMETLPVCRTEEEARSTLVRIRRLPTCIPPGLSPDRLSHALGIDLGAEVTRMALDPIPNAVPFSHAELRDALNDPRLLDDARSLLRNGWTYTHDDLRDDLTARGNEAVYDALQDARSLLAGGWTYTQDDFVEDVTEREGAEAMADIDRGRAAVSTARTFRWLAYIPALMLLVVVGLLGGRDWWGRLLWGAAALVVCALGVALLSFLVYPTVASGLMDEARSQAISEIDPADHYAATGRLVTDKMFDVIESASDRFGEGIATSSLVLVVVAGIVIAAVVNRQRIAEFLRRARDRRPRSLSTD